jgi:CDP-glucose 4,6-dehydratase
LSRHDLDRTYRGRRVLVTGHTGFKGSWLALWLCELGAEVHGYALAPATDPDLFTAARVGAGLAGHTLGDVRDLPRFAAALAEARPEIVFHLAAQPLVAESYRDPVGTVTTNVVGTTHLLDIVRRAPEPPAAVVVVTSDKCYENREWPYPYRESDTLGGQDLYSASKAAAELVVDAFRRSFLAGRAVAVASARAGNVIGGGDWSPHRIVPDSVRALAAGEPIRVRNPAAVRPWQHVLEPLSGYLSLGSHLLSAGARAGADLCTAWNFGPEPGHARTVSDVVETLLAAWGHGRWETTGDEVGAEATLLTLAIDKARTGLSWSPRWGFATAVTRTAAWYRTFYDGDVDAASLCKLQIGEYMEEGP